MDEKCFEHRLASILANDRRADGEFLYGVRTTRIYCRPSCKSRPPRPENVVFFESSADAERAGFRPCKRCTPHRAAPRERKVDRIARICRLIEESDRTPQLTELAREAGMSRFHFHRLFKATVGMTPHQYVMLRRDRRVRSALSEGHQVIDAAFGAGYESSGHFYSAATRALGMTPQAFRDRGAGHVIRFAVGETAFGSILVAGTARGICTITMGDDADTLVRELQDRFARAELIGGDTEFETYVARVVGFVDAPSNSLDLPLDLQGTVFQQRVWRALQEIPCGDTASYADIATRIGSPKAARAVAQACASNPVALAIPCHRVVRTNGELSGYRWGVARKRDLLQREAQAVAVGGASTVIAAQAAEKERKN